MPQHKKDELLHHCREYYAEKKKDKEAGAKSPPLKYQCNKYKNTDRKYVPKTGARHSETGVCFPKNAASQNELPSLDNDLSLFSDKNLLKSWTGQVYHFLNGLKPSNDKPSGIQLYFYDTKEELSRKLDASPRLRESTFKLLMNVLGQNPYTRFFKGLRDIPNLENHTIV
ncbi:hypothetical protein ACH5RR_002742 [Cinchona calisaya]|uniref:Uncharacterized protein n=1 Tax=Cinchona calisaya TaxID=153742 RepID=A0ABD3ASW5_9GENT